jgi:hypothetical protein
MSEWLRYCNRFAQDTYANFLIFGLEPKHQFERFDTDLTHSVHSLCTYFEIDTEDSLFPQSTSYFAVCNLMPTIKKVNIMENSEKLQKRVKCSVSLDAVLSRAGAVVTEDLRAEVKRDMKAVQAAVASLQGESMDETIIKPYFVIQQKALREFWITKIHPKLSVSQKKLAILVQTFLSARGAGSVLAVELANIFKACTTNELDPTKHVDCFTIAKLGRKVRFDEPNFVEVVKEIADSKAQTVLPHLANGTFDEVIFDDDQEQTLTKLFHRVGWSVITGPKLSGKTCRLLHCAHNNCPRDEKDCVWLNFDGIVSETDGISRIAQTLFFRKCISYADVESQINQYFCSLRLGSVVVLDNVRLGHKRLTGIGTGSLLLHDCGRGSQQKIIHFFKKILSICRLHSRSLSFIIVTDYPEIVSKEVHFMDRVTIGPMDGKSADRMVDSLEKSVRTVFYFRCLSYNK